MSLQQMKGVPNSWRRLHHWILSAGYDINSNVWEIQKGRTQLWINMDEILARITVSHVCYLAPDIMHACITMELCFLSVTIMYYAIMYKLAATNYTIILCFLGLTFFTMLLYICFHIFGSLKHFFWNCVRFDIPFWFWPVGFFVMSGFS
jgi:hypothetical protein